MIHAIIDLLNFYNFSNGYAFLTIILFAGVAYSIKAKKLTITASITGVGLAYLIYASAGYTGILMMIAFFLMGTAATGWKLQHKLKHINAGESKSGRRASQVFANAGVPGMASVVMLIYPNLANLMPLLMGAAFAAATADTLSSELGIVYGQRFFNIITLKADKCGLDGVVSIEGTIFGALGSALIASIYAMGFGWNVNFLLIFFAGTSGNLFDSILGATLERKGLLGNDAVNFLNTTFAALVALLLSVSF